MGEKKPNDLQKAHSVLDSECLLFPCFLSTGFAPHNTGVPAHFLEITIIPRTCMTSVLFIFLLIRIIYIVYTN